VVWARTTVRAGARGSARDRGAPADATACELDRPGAAQPRPAAVCFQAMTISPGSLDPQPSGPTTTTDKRKQSLYFPEEMLKEIQDEAMRQDRSLSWIVQKAWKIARKDLMKYPSVDDLSEG
jgi:uncharacterized small protein (TIGR04563 family)